MSARDALHAFRFEHGVELPGRAAFAVGNKDRAIAVTLGADFIADRRRDAFRPIVQLSRQTAHVQCRPLVHAAQCCDFAGECAAGDDQNAAMGLHGHSPAASGDARGAAGGQQALRGLHCNGGIAAAASAPTALPNSSFSGAPPTNLM